MPDGGFTRRTQPEFRPTFRVIRSSPAGLNGNLGEAGQGGYVGYRVTDVSGGTGLACAFQDPGSKPVPPNRYFGRNGLVVGRDNLSSPSLGIFRAEVAAALLVARSATDTGYSPPI